jgi:hypothetical protein
MAAEANVPPNFAPHHFDSAPKASLVIFGASSRRRAVWPQLTERQIAAEDCESRRAQSVSECD